MPEGPKAINNVKTNDLPGWDSKIGTAGLDSAQSAAVAEERGRDAEEKLLGGPGAGQLAPDTASRSGLDPRLPPAPPPVSHPAEHSPGAQHESVAHASHAKKDEPSAQPAAFVDKAQAVAQAAVGAPNETHDKSPRSVALRQDATRPNTPTSGTQHDTSVAQHRDAEVAQHRDAQGGAAAIAVGATFHSAVTREAQPAATQTTPSPGGEQPSERAQATASERASDDAANHTADGPAASTPDRTETDGTSVPYPERDETAREPTESPLAREARLERDREKLVVPLGLRRDVPYEQRPHRTGEVDEVGPSARTRRRT